MFWATLNFQVYFEANYLTTRCFRNAKTYFDHSTSHQNKSISHLDIWSSSNSSSQRVSPLYEGVDSILRIPKNICVCEFRLGFLSYNNNNNKKKALILFHHPTFPLTSFWCMHGIMGHIFSKTKSNFIFLLQEMKRKNTKSKGGNPKPMDSKISKNNMILFFKIQNRKIEEGYICFLNLSMITHVNVYIFFRVNEKKKTHSHSLSPIFYFLFLCLPK